MEEDTAMTVRLSPIARQLLERLKRQQGGNYRTIIEAAIRLMGQVHGFLDPQGNLIGGASDTAVSTTASARKK